MVRHLSYIMLLILCLSGFTKLSAQTRHALFIGISNYPAYSEWNSLHADNDSSILYKIFTAHHMPCGTSMPPRQKLRIPSTDYWQLSKAEILY